METIYSQLNQPFNFKFQVENKINHIDLFNKIKKVGYDVYEFSKEAFSILFNEIEPKKCFQLEISHTGYTQHYTAYRSEKFFWFFNNNFIWKFIPETGFIGSSYTFNDKKEFEEFHKELFKEIGYENYNLNQYKYCHAILTAFWKRVFNKTPGEMWCGGIVTAHGDKAYGYKREWEKEGIPFNRGVLIYLLTYTKEMDQDKSESYQFVIDKYQHYLPMILEAEKEVFFNESEE